MKNNTNIVHADADLADDVVWYKEKLQTHLCTAREALKAMDIAVVQNVGHRIKGSAQSFGFHWAGEIGKRLELAAKEKDVHAMAQCLALLSDFLDQVEIVFD